MKILALNWRDPLHPEVGGAEIHLDALLSHLALKHQVVLISTEISPQRNNHSDIHSDDCETTEKRKGETSDCFSFHGYEIRRWGHPLFFHLTFKKLWVQKLKSENFEIIIDDISKIGLQTPRIINNIPIVALFHHVHGHTLFQLLPLPMALYVYTMERIALKSYINTPMIVVSESSRQELLEIAPFRKLSILPNGIEDSYLQPRNISKKPLQFCSVGRLTYAKRVDLTLEVFQKLLLKHPSATLKIAGKGKDSERLKSIAEKLNITHALTFLGYIPEEEKKTLLEESVGFIFTSEKEGWGITAIESSASSTPVFAFDVAGVRDSVQQGVNGFLVPFGDTEALSELIQGYLASDQQILQGRAFCYAKNFGWKKITEEFEMFLYNTLSEF